MFLGVPCLPYAPLPPNMEGDDLDMTQASNMTHLSTSLFPEVSQRSKVKGDCGGRKLASVMEEGSKRAGSDSGVESSSSLGSHETLPGSPNLTPEALGQQTEAPSRCEVPSEPAEALYCEPAEASSRSYLELGAPGREAFIDAVLMEERGYVTFLEQARDLFISPAQSVVMPTSVKDAIFQNILQVFQLLQFLTQ